VVKVDPALQSAYVVLGAGGQVVARAITTADACPSIRIDATVQEMQTRAAPGEAPLRPKQGKPSQFPVRVCEAIVPGEARVASVAGQSLALPAARPQRIVVLGDTGCRIKQADHAYQDCSDAAAWPFRAVADAAAREHPDLVVHVGDYHYRENACPAGERCTSGPWGYGWDAWNADFFVPARSLLAAAPWVAARGNHEMCSRAGQGWFRMLDAAVPDDARSCDRPEQDEAADFSQPYAVPLGTDWQLIVFDSARASRPLDPARPEDARALDRYERQLDAVAALAAAPGIRSIFVSHHPALGFGALNDGTAVFGTPALLAPMRARFGSRYYPAGVDLTLHGHVHTFEAIAFSSGQPAALVTGHGGDNLDTEVPRSLAAAYPDAPGVQIDFAVHAGGFGYLVLDREARGWRIRAQGVDGTIQAVCTLQEGRLACPQHGPANLALPAPR
jgi:hypothetical protein